MTQLAITAVSGPVRIFTPFCFNSLGRVSSRLKYWWNVATALVGKLVVDRTSQTASSPC